jgi:anti-sigma-K factor RskA
MDDQLHLLTGAYALNALDDDERRRFERALPFGDPTAEEARELSETAALLAAGTTPVPPPPALKERLMAQVAVTPQVGATPQPVTPPTSSRPVTPEAGSAPVAPSPLHGKGDGASRGGGRRRALPPVARWLAAAAAVLLVAGVGTGVWGLQAQQQRDAALRELAAAQTSRSGVIDRILSEPDAKVQEVPAPGGATMLIAHSKDAQLAGVVTIGMAAPPAGKAYELWLIDAGGAAKPAGLVAVAEGSTWNELPGGLDGAALLGVTVEPAAGSPQPTTQPILLAPIA